MNPTQKQMDLIHYGTSKFSYEEIRAVTDSHWVKPRGSGFWASPVKSEWGWKDWCLSQEFNLERLQEHVLLTLRGNVITIDRVEDLELLDWYLPKGAILSQHGIRFGKMFEAGIDAIHLTTEGEEATRFSRPKGLYGWDCESVLIMNPGCLTVVQHCPDYTKPQPPIPARKRMITLRK